MFTRARLGQPQVAPQDPGGAQDSLTLRAEQEVMDADKLRASGIAGDLRKALNVYGSALAVWRSEGDRHHTASTLLRMGEVSGALYDDAQSEKLLAEARALAHEIGDSGTEAESLIATGMLLLRRADLQQALGQVEEADRISAQTGNRAMRASATASLAEIYYDVGDMAKASDYALTSLGIAKEIGSPRGVALALFECGYISMARRDNDKALEFLNQSLAAARGANDLPLIVDALTHIGHFYSLLGEKQRALGYYVEAEPAAELLQDPERQGRLYNGLDFINDELGNIELSLQYCRKTIEMYHAANYSIGEAQILWRLGRIQTRLGQFQDALRSYQQALAFFQSHGMRRNVYYVLSDVGELYAARGNDTAAGEYYAQARQLINTEEDPREYSYLLDRIGRVTEHAGETVAALEFYRQALKLNRANRDLLGESQTQMLVAAAEKKLGHLAEARAAVEAAIGIDETVRDEVAVSDLRASYFAEVNQHFDFYIDLLMRAGEESDSLKALEVSERKRARTLLDEVARSRAKTGPGGVEASFAERERKLKAQIEAKRDEYAKVKQDKRYATQAEGIAAELSRLAQEYDQLHSVIASGNAFKPESRPPPLTAREIRDAFSDGDTLLLEYSLGEERSYLWAMSREGIHSYELPKRAVIEQEVSGLSRAIRMMTPGGIPVDQQAARLREAEEQFRRRAQGLAEILLAPASDRVRAAKRLVVAADGALHHVPFAALPEPLPDAARSPAKPGPTGGVTPPPLLAGHEITMLPSVSVLVASRKAKTQMPPPTKLMAIIANPVFEKDDDRIRIRTGPAAGAEAGRPPRAATTRGAADGGPDGEDAAASRKATEAAISQVLRDTDADGGAGTLPRLFSTQREAQEILSLAGPTQSFAALGFEANRSVLTGDTLKDYRFIHIATHGFFDSEHPELSGIVLSLYNEKGQPQNGFVQLRDIYDLDLHADMVVLSACQTGLGRELQGEGITGLSRAFMSAGARRVVASLWKVDDDATAELMMSFYRHLLKERMTPAAALRAAQLEISSKGRWRRPFYWAGFFLTGEFR